MNYEPETRRISFDLSEQAVSLLTAMLPDRVLWTPGATQCRQYEIDNEVFPEAETRAEVQTLVQLGLLYRQGSIGTLRLTDQGKAVAQVLVSARPKFSSTAALETVAEDIESLMRRMADRVADALNAVEGFEATASMEIKKGVLQLVVDITDSQLRSKSEVGKLIEKALDFPDRYVRKPPPSAGIFFMATGRQRGSWQFFQAGPEITD